MTFDPLDRRTEPGNELVMMPIGGVRRGLRRLSLAIRCEYCGRAWRIPQTQRLGEANANYLYEHVDLHVREVARRPAQHWQAGGVDRGPD